MKKTLSPVLEEARREGELRRAAMTIQQASEYASLSRSFIYTLFEQQALRRLKAGKRVLILREDLDIYLLSIAEAAK